MAWSYSGDPSRSTREAIRFSVGDTDTNDQFVRNAGMDYLITQHATVNRTASEVARAISAKFARLMSRSIGGMQADFAAKYRQYAELADDLITKEETEPVSPFASGWKRDAKEARMEDTNREPLAIRKGSMDNNRAYPADEYYPVTGYRTS